MDNQNQEMVVACVDGSMYTNDVSDYAAWASQRIGVPLKLLHNIEYRDISPMDLSGSIGFGAQEHLLNELVSLEEQRSKIVLEEGKKMLSQVRERINARGYGEPILRQRHGSLPETLVDCEHEIRLLVMGIRGESKEAYDDQLGGHLETVARALHKPILVVNRRFTEPKKIMLAFDGSVGAKKALDMIAQRPLFKGTACHLVNVNHKQVSQEYPISHAAEELRGAGFDVTVAELEGDPQEVLCNYQQQENIDLTLMGAFSHNRIRDLIIGSFTVKMLLKTQQPLLLLR
ncbi:universal stress protein [Gynuella sp.]|uniref:universal stress protein n=1 Tax=Gynuella sp. TaxID=2969146 RepID=UPI003D141BC2